MAKGFQANKERQEAIAALGKILAKRAKFRCEWCEGSGDIRPWDARPEEEPAEATVALLCSNCRELAAARTASENDCRAIRNALWSDIPAVAEGAARVVARCGEPWAREAIEESMIDEEVKRRLLG